MVLKLTYTGVMDINTELLSFDSGTGYSLGITTSKSAPHQVISKCSQVRQCAGIGSNWQHTGTIWHLRRMWMPGLHLRRIKWGNSESKSEHWCVLDIL